MVQWDTCRWVWNACVETSKTAHVAGVECGPAGLHRMLTAWRSGSAWLAEGSSVAQQQTIRDFSRCRFKALKDIKNRLPVKRRAGMPSFKKKHLAAPSMNFTRRGFHIKDGRLHLPRGIALRVVWSRHLPSEPTSVRVHRDALGHWYASFVVDLAIEPTAATGDVIGIDWGVKDIATTTSDTHDLPHPEHGKRNAAKLTRYQRAMARRKPAKGKLASRGYRKVKHQVAKSYKKAARQRLDTARKWAKRVVRDHDVIAAEDFRPKFLARSTMASKAADAAIGATKSALIEMARKHGRVLHLVDPTHTTTDCGNCGARAKHRLLLSQRIYTCTTCGNVCPRDKNSARVMLNRAGLNPAGIDCVTPARP